MNRIAVTSEGPSLDDQVDPRFGRAAGFVVVDLETMDTQYIDNGKSQVMAQGAGIQAAELIARAGVSCLLTGYVGPKAFQALTGAGIKVVQNLEGLTVRIEAFCGKQSYPVIGRLPHDPVVTQAMVQGLVVTELPETDFSRQLGQVWSRIESLAG